jgi:hypothetical protein
MGGIRGLMGLLFLIDNEKESPIQSVIKGQRELPKEKQDILRDLKSERKLMDKTKPPEKGTKSQK